MKKWREMITLLTPLLLSCLRGSNLAETPVAENSPITDCNNSSCLTIEPAAAEVECLERCGCDGIYKFDQSKLECVLNYEYLKERTESKNLMNVEKIRESTERVFHGIIWSALFFVICAGVGVISVCLFCCRIHYSDNKLNNEVKALASKLKVDYHKRESYKKKPRNPKEESCNVIVEDANIMCV